MTTLSDLSAGRDNNLNLIRAIAATAVLVSHAWPIALGPGTVQPLQLSTGHTLGTLSVYAFFVISGFLIAMSFERSSSRKRFVQARVLRLVPGLAVSLLLVAFVIGPVVTALPVGQYLTHPELYTFLARNMALVLPQYTLPGVFTELPYTAIEGSIWTLIYEVACYVGVFLAGITGLLARRGAVTGVICVYIIGWAVKDALGIKIQHQVDLLYTLSVPFAFGMLVYLWQHRLPLKWYLCLGLVAACVVLRSTVVYELLLHITMAYVIFWLAYVPDGRVRDFNRLGDYSYGIYIYAFPLQGLAVWLFGPQTPLENILYALPLTLACSVASWHWVEKPALDLRHRGRAKPTAS